MTERTSGDKPLAEPLIQPSAGSGGQESEHEEPRGTLVLLLFFLVAMVGIWLYVYFLLLERQ